MKSFLKQLSSGHYDVELVPETLEEQKLLKENKDSETIEIYYHSAVSRELGPDASLLRVVDQSRWPKSAIVAVAFSKGLG